MISQSQAPNPTLLLTRPQAQSLRFLDQVQARFGPMPHLIAPLLAAQGVQAKPVPPVGAVIFTSETGALMAGQSGIWAQAPAPKAAFCVGARTAEAARAMGYLVQDAQGDWRDLVALIAATAPQGDLAWPCAAESADHLDDHLRDLGYTLHRRVVYRQIAVPLSDQARSLLAGDTPVLLPLFSPRSAALFCAAADPVAPIWLAALSPAIAAAFSRPFARLQVADRPNSAELLRAMGDLLK